MRYLSSESDAAEPHEAFPVNGVALLRAAVQAVRSASGTVGVEIDVEAPAMTVEVLGSPAGLQAAFEALLRAMILDAPRGSRLLVEVTDMEKESVFRIRDRGFGLPDDRLQEYLRSEDELESPELEGLRRSRRWVAAWGGSLDIRSVPAEGMRVELRLLRFL
jgi:signal transduction histidine kinase